MDEVLRVELEAKAGAAERSVIEAAIGGDAEAFAALYDQYLERVYRHVYYWVGNRTDAEDLTQQVFLLAWQAIGRYKQTGASFISWLLTIAHNLAVSFWRRAKETLYLELEPVSDERWADPEAETLAKYDRLAMRRALLRLKPEQQQVITMRFMEHLAYADIAAALRKSEGNVRVIQHRALTEFRRLLAHEVKA